MTCEVTYTRKVSEKMYQSCSQSLTASGKLSDVFKTILSPRVALSEGNCDSQNTPLVQIGVFEDVDTNSNVNGIYRPSVGVGFYASTDSTTSTYANVSAGISRPKKGAESQDTYGINCSRGATESYRCEKNFLLTCKIDDINFL